MHPAIQPSATVSVFRATINRQNAQHSTGPRTEAGKRRSSLNALQHGLTATSAVLPSEDPPTNNTASTFGTNTNPPLPPKRT